MSTSSSRSTFVLFMTRLLAFGLLMIAIQFLVGPIVTRHMIPPGFHTLLEECHAPSPYIYFGDSLVCSIERRDSDRRNQVEMTQVILEQPMTMLAHPAFHQRVFNAFAHHMARHQALSKVKAVFLPVNPRSFSPAWDMRPEWQFERLLFLLRHEGIVARAFFHPMAAFQYISLTPVSTRMFLDTPLIVADNTVMSMRDVESLYQSGDHEAQFSAEFMAYYMYDLEEDHRSLQALSDTLDLLHTAGVIPVVYIPPIDREEGVRRHGMAFDRQLDRNINIIREVVSRHRGTLHDLSRIMPSSRFAYAERVNEHLDDTGRRLLAGQLVEILQQTVK